MLKKFKVTHLLEPKMSWYGECKECKGFCRSDAGVMWHPEFAGVMLNRDPWVISDIESNAAKIPSGRIMYLGIGKKSLFTVMIRDLSFSCLFYAC